MLWFSSTVERIRKAEQEAHLGDEPYRKGDSTQANSRNSYSKKTVKTSSGPLDLDIPRDRKGTFEPKIIQKHQGFDPQLEKQITGMYARGMTVRDIQSQLEEFYGTEVSPKNKGKNPLRRMGCPMGLSPPRIRSAPPRGFNPKSRAGPLREFFLPARSRRLRTKECIVIYMTEVRRRSNAAGGKKARQWVPDGVRTHDSPSHSRVLYQLSYGHHYVGPKLNQEKSFRKKTLTQFPQNPQGSWPTNFVKFLLQRNPGSSTNFPHYSPIHLLIVQPKSP